MDSYEISNVDIFSNGRYTFCIEYICFSYLKKSYTNCLGPH